jgi:hypothetical protein
MRLPMLRQVCTEGNAMALPEGFLAVLECLGRVFETYTATTGGHAVLVGGAATAFHTGGQYLSRDFDVIAARDDEFIKALLSEGFRPEDRKGHLMVGHYHPDYPTYGVQLVTGPLFDGRSSHNRLIRIEIAAGSAFTTPGIEDLIADRLAQHAVAATTDTSRLRQAQQLLQMAESVDFDYLVRRTREEGGDPSLLGMQGL